MAQTEKGIIYPYDYNEVADVPSDFKALAESIDALLNDYSLKTDSGNKIVLEMNNTTYKIKAALKDKDDNVISTSNEIDLPLENMVTNISYNDQTLTLTHQDGQTTEVSIADLISDLASKEEVSELQSQVDDLTTLVETELESNEVEGTEIDVSDSAEYPGKIIPMGNLEQEQLSGKNVLDPSTIGTGTFNGINYSYDENTQEITLNGTCTKDNTLISFVHTNIIASASKTNFCAYCVDGSISGYGTLRFYDANYMAGCILYINELTKGNYILKQVKESYEAVNNNFRFNAGTVCNNFKIKVMVTDSTDTTYEPYCGGQPSPNPDYPQPIKVVTGDNVVKHVGKNEFLLQNKLKSVASSVTSSISDSSTNSFIMFGKNVWGNQSVLFDNLKNKTLSLSAIYTNRASVNTRIRLQAYGVNVIDYVSADLVNLGIVDYNLTDKNPHKLSITFNSGDYEYILFRFWNNATNTVLSENTDMLVDNIQLEEGLTPTQYEPYRGEEYKLDLWKENEFDKDNANIYGGYLDTNGIVNGSGSGAYDTIVYIECKPNTTYLLKKTQQIDTENNRFRIGCTSEIPVRNMQTTNFFKYADGTSETEYAYTTSSTARYLLFYCGRASETTSREQLLNSIQIQEAIELCKIGDYSDILFKNEVGDENFVVDLEEGAWYKKGVIQKEIFDGSIDEGWQINSGAISDKTIYLTSDAIDNKLKENYMGISNYLINSRISLWSTEVQAMQLMTNVSRHIRLRVDKTTASNTDGFRTWLSTHNLELYYASAETTYTKITDSTLISQLEALRKAKWFKGVNHWWTETENLEPNLKGTYKQSNNLRLQALEQAVVALGGV